MDPIREVLDRFDALENEFASRPRLNQAKPTTTAAEEQALSDGIDWLDKALAWKPNFPKPKLPNLPSETNDSESADGNVTSLMAELNVKKEAPVSDIPPNASFIDRNRALSLSSDEESDDPTHRKLKNRKRLSTTLPFDLEHHRSKRGRRSPSLDQFANEYMNGQTLGGFEDDSVSVEHATAERTSKTPSLPPRTSRASLGTPARQTSRATLGSRSPQTSRASLGTPARQTSRATLGSRSPQTSRAPLGSTARQTSRDTLGPISTSRDTLGPISTSRAILGSTDVQTSRDTLGPPPFQTSGAFPPGPSVPQTSRASLGSLTTTTTSSSSETPVSQTVTKLPSTTSSSSKAIAPPPNRSVSPRKRQVVEFGFAVWLPSTQSWMDIEAMPEPARTLIETRFKSLYQGKGKTYKDRTERFARATDPKNIATYLDKKICLAGSFIDKRNKGIEGDVACETCVRLRYARICVQLVTVNGETKFGVMPLPEDERTGLEGDTSFWFSE